MHHPQRNNVFELKQPSVRFGEPADESQVKLLLMLGHAENSIFKFDIRKADFVIRRLLYTRLLPPNDTGLRGCFGVIGPLGGTLEALTMMAISSLWYTGEVHLEEYIVYVHPEYRTKGHAGRLLQWMIDISEQMGVPIITGIITRDRMEAKVRMYKKKFTPVGQYFLHMPKSNPYWESQRVLDRFQVTKSSSAAA